MRPRCERLVLGAENQFGVLEKLIEKSHIPRTAKEPLEKYAAGVAKQPQVMVYLKKPNKALSEKIQGLTRARELELERDRE